LNKRDLHFVIINGNWKRNASLKMSSLIRLINLDRAKIDKLRKGEMSG